MRAVCHCCAVLYSTRSLAGCSIILYWQITMTPASARVGLGEDDCHGSSLSGGLGRPMCGCGRTSIGSHVARGQGETKCEAGTTVRSPTTAQPEARDPPSSWPKFASSHPISCPPGCFTAPLCSHPTTRHGTACACVVTASCYCCCVAESRDARPASHLSTASRRQRVFYP